MYQGGDTPALSIYKLYNYNMFMLHPSRILVSYLIIYLLAIAAASALLLSGVDIIYCFTPLLLAIFFWRVSWLRYISLALFVVLLAFGQISSLASPILLPGSSINQGTVVSEPKASNYNQNLIVKLDTGGKASVFVPTYPVFQIGDRVVLNGSLSLVQDDSFYLTNPGYFWVRSIRFTGRDVEIYKEGEFTGGVAGLKYKVERGLINVRKKYELTLSKVLPEPYAGLAIGILLGGRSQLSDNLNNLFISLGVIHIMALSGYNITIIADSLRRVSRGVSAHFSFWFALSGVWAFVMATGFSASVVRAAIMGTMLLLARRLGRQSDAYVAIVLAAAVMVSINPYILLYDLGFQLSFVAMGGLIFLAPRITPHFAPLGKKFGEILGTTIAAQIFTLPLLSYYFGRISLISVVANLLILPIVPFVMTLSFVVGTVGILSLWLAERLGYILWLCLGYIMKVATTLGVLPGIEKGYQIGLLTMIGIYLLLIELILIMKRKKIEQT